MLARIDLSIHFGNIRDLTRFTHPGTCKGGFPLSRNFYVRTDVNFNWLYVRKLR